MPEGSVAVAALLGTTLACSRGRATDVGSCSGEAAALLASLPGSPVPGHARRHLPRAPESFSPRRQGAVSCSFVGVAVHGQGKCIVKVSSLVASRRSS